MKANITNLEELRRAKKVKFKDLKKTLSVQTWYNVLNRKHEVTEKVKTKLCALFGITEKQFILLVKKI